MSNKLNLSNDDFESAENVVYFKKIQHKKAIKTQTHDKTYVRQNRALKSQRRYAA